MRYALRVFGEPDDGPRRAALVRRAIALFGLALVAVTWRLWTPQHVFPQVPLVWLVGTLPPWCDWIGAAGMLGGLVVALVAPERGRAAPTALVVFAICTGALVAIDQQRLQPWAYQFLLAAIIFALADARGALALLRLLVVSFYFHSALTKFDYSFLHTLGQQFLSVLVSSAALDAWSEPWRLAAAAMFPAGELLVAVGLCFGRTRLVALCGAVVLHLLLLVILGPWGLGHRPGVLVWNVFFIVQDVLLFAGPKRAAALQPRAGDTVAIPIRVPWSLQAMVLAVVVLPFLWPTGWFDLWPSWGLYAASAERVTLLVHRRERDALDDDLQRFVQEPADPLDPWLAVRIDRWALESLGAPIYPQSRCQLGVAEAVIVRYGLGHRARVVRWDLADRWTGERAHAVFNSLPQLLAAGDRYFFNCRWRSQTFQPSLAVAP